MRLVAAFACTVWFVCLTVSVSAQNSDAEARADFELVSRVGTKEAWEAYLRKYQSGFYSDLARIERDKLAGVGYTPPITPVPARPCGGVILTSLSTRAAQTLSASEECALKPKDVFKECDKCPAMVVVPSGSFLMGAIAERGSPPGYDGRRSVTIGLGFAVGPFAVTFEEWDACVADGGCNGYKPADSWGRGRQPVINVSWDDAKAYVTWLSGKTGKTYRLLSEAEREYVTRAGTTTPFWWGESISTSQANYNGNYTLADTGESVRESKGEFPNQTLPVDAFAPNPWGLYQVHGNVYEWVEDCYHATNVGAASDGSAWISGDCKSHFLRGGSWDFVPRNLRAHFGISYPSNTRSDSIGFRVARTLAP